ncbi:MAG: hypothetical protein KAS80_06410 [Anaerolineales bacterium]|nr:hypothetical protein [Anaerolineales bacterium]
MDVQSAVQNLVDALKAAVGEKKSAGIQAFEAGEYDLAQQVANQAKAIEPIIEAADHIAKQWDALQAPQDVLGTKRTKAKDLEPTEVDFVIPILQVLEDEGGKGPTNEILDRVKLIIKDQLKADDYELLDDSKTIRWRESAQSSIKIMVKRGLLHSKAPKDTLRITPQGRLYFFEQQK